MTFVTDFLNGEFSNQLNAGQIFQAFHIICQLLIRDVITFQQSQKIQVFEFRQQVFSVELVVIQVMS